jgi:ADP-ribose pyrophosphatase YjhB (NUDIX family)
MESQSGKSITCPRWLEWAREIQALAQTGDQFAANDFQRERYHRLAEIAAEIISEHTALDSTAVMEIYQSQAGYATPKVDVRAAAFRGGKLLLVRERSDGGWTMPGGWADVGDTPSESAEREAWEEAGFRIKARKLVGVYDANRISPMELMHAYKLVFLCEVISGEATPSVETSEVAYFTQSEIPVLLSEKRTPLRIIQNAFNALNDPGWSAVFD